MSLHIGRNRYISEDKIIGLFNFKTDHNVKINKKFIKNNETDNTHKKGKIKTFIVMETGSIYFSSIRTKTLCERMENKY